MNKKESWPSVMALIGFEGVPRPSAELTPRHMVSFAENFLGLPHDFFATNHGRMPREITDKKIMVRAYLRLHYKVSFPQIAGMTCKTDHSNVISSVNTHHAYYAHNPEYREKYSKFANECEIRGFYTPNHHLK